MSNTSLQLFASQPPLQPATQRDVWLRRGTVSYPHAPGHWHPVSLSELGNAAARETFTTSTLHFAAAWTDLFRSMIAAGPDLRWLENGPGVGRDARIAYSGLFGRYVARAYLTGNENVRVLVPLDVAKRLLDGTPYSIVKCPPGHGLEADWIGLDGQRRLVIAEAKGSFDKAVRTWSGPDRLPDVLHTAIGQAQRTAVFATSFAGALPAKRWAIASRWANEMNGRCPTVIAWDPDEGPLDDDDYGALARLLHRCDVEGVLKGLGHADAIDTVNAQPPSPRLPGDIWLRVGDRPVDPGFAAVLGPVGIHPLRRNDDLDRVRLIREVTPNVALASLSSHYASTIFRDPLAYGEWASDEAVMPSSGGSDRFMQRAGLTIAWPTPDQDIGLTVE